MSKDGIQSQRVICVGGLDSANNYLQLSVSNPGAAVRLINYESSLLGGYRRINGYIPLDEEVDAAGAEGAILSIVGFYNDDAQEHEIIVARKQQSGNTYKFYKWDNPGWSDFTTGFTHNTTDGQKIVRRVRHEVFNFGNKNMICFVDGVNPATLYDGTDWFQITTAGLGTSVSPGGDQVTNKPSCVTSFRNHLFLSGDYTEPSALMSCAPNDPFDWTAAGGSLQQRVGFNPIQIKPFRDELFVFGREKIRKSVASTNSTGEPTFIIQDVTNNIGCIARDSVIELAGSLLFLAPDGIRPIAGTEKINDVEISSISGSIQSIIAGLDGQYDLDFVNGLVIRKKSQFRYFISDDSDTTATAYGIIGCYKERSDSRWEFGELLGIRSASCWSGYYDLEEYVLHGDYDGVVYKQEEGTTFNDADITAIYATPFLDMGDTEIRKVGHKLNTFLRTEGTVTLDIGIKFDWLKENVQYPSNYNLSSSSSGTEWDDPDILWDSATYGTDAAPVLEQDIEGSFFSIQFLFVTQGDYDPYTIFGHVIEFSPQGRN